MSGNSLRHLKMQYAGHTLAASGGRLKIGPLSCAHACCDRGGYRWSNLDVLYSLENRFARDRELVRSVDLEITQDGTFECYLAAMLSPGGAMNFVEIVAINFLLHPEAEPTNLTSPP